VRRKAAVVSAARAGVITLEESVGATSSRKRSFLPGSARLKPMVFLAYGLLDFRITVDCVRGGPLSRVSGLR